MASGGKWLEIGNGRRWYVAHDSKTTPQAGIPNTWGWMPGKAHSCAGAASDACDAFCYVKGIAKYSKETAATLANNWTVLTDLARELGGWNSAAFVAAVTDIFVASIDTMIAATDRANVRREKAGIKPLEYYFRLQWSGEMYSDGIAHAIAAAMTLRPSVHY